MGIFMCIDGFKIYNTIYSWKKRRYWPYLRTRPVTLLETLGFACIKYNNVCIHFHWGLFYVQQLQSVFQLGLYLHTSLLFSTQSAANSKVVCAKFAAQSVDENYLRMLTEPFGKIVKVLMFPALVRQINALLHIWMSITKTNTTRIQIYYFVCIIRHGIVLCKLVCLGCRAEWYGRN